MTKRLYGLLGPLAIEEDGQPAALLRSPVGCALIVYLIVTGQPQNREVVAGLFWDDASTADSLRNLRSLLNRIRKWAPDLSITGNRLAFQPGPDTRVDLLLLREALAADNLEALDTALLLYRGDLLESLYLQDAPRFEEWLLLARERLRRQVLDAHERLCRAYRSRGQLAQALDVARRWLALDPLDEAALRQVMALLALDGQPNAALQQYATASDSLMRALELRPEPATADLAERIRSGEFRPRPMAEAARETPARTTRFDWDETPLVGSFFGRAAELVQLRRWLIDEGCQMVAIYGIGGIGKTTLSAQLVRTAGNQFTTVVWRSLLNAPRLGELLPAILQVLSGFKLDNVPHSLDGQLSMLLELLRSERCLLVLDNVETIMTNDEAGTFRSGYEDFGQLLRFLAEQDHQSSLLITSREVPATLARQTNAGPRVRTMLLEGLGTVGARRLLRFHGLDLADRSSSALIDRYSGNPLALHLVAETIQKFFGGDVSAFLHDAAPIFGDIRNILDQQFSRLSSLEQEILIWLAIAREPLTLRDLQAMFARPVAQRNLLEALWTLQRRSLLEKSGAGFVLQNVITEYLTDVVVERSVQELRTGQLDLLRTHSMLRAQASSYLRRSQERLILQPVRLQLLAEPGERVIGASFRRMLDRLREEMHPGPGYAAGNLLNLLLHMGVDVTGFDFSRLPVWQAYLQEDVLRDLSFASSDLSGSLFHDVFGLVNTVAFSPNGRLLATGDGTGQVRLWDVAGGQSALTLRGHADAIWSVSFSPDGRLLASGSADNTVRLWDTLPQAGLDQSAAERLGVGHDSRILAGHTARVQAVAFSPDGQWLASGSEDRTIRIWDPYSGQLQHVVPAHDGNVQTVAFDPGGRFLASGSRDQTIRLWQVSALIGTAVGEDGDEAGLQAALVLRGHTNWVNEIAFSPDGKTLASGSEDGTLCLWDLTGLIDDKGAVDTRATLSPSRIFRDHRAGVQSVAFSSNGSLLASAGHDQTIRLWDLRSARLVNVLQGHTNWVYSICFSPNSQMLASGSWDHSVRLWQPHNGRELRLFKGHSNWVFSVAFSPDGQTLACGSADNNVRLWQAPQLAPLADEAPSGAGRLQKTLVGHADWAWKVAFSPDGRLLASASMDCTVRIWDARRGQTVHQLQGHDDGLQAITFSPDGRMLATGGLDQVILLWDLSSGQLLHKLKGHTGWCLSLNFSPDGRWLVSSGGDHTVRLWDLSLLDNHLGSSAGEVLYEHGDGVQQARFSPDGRLLASGSWDKTVVIWDVERGKVRYTLRGHTNIVRPVAFSPDGLTLLSGSDDRTICLWDVAGGQLLHVLEGHRGWVFSADFSPNGLYVASASSDETIRIWDAATGAWLQTWPLPKPYAGMNITGATGLTQAQRMALKELGAVE